VAPALAPHAIYTVSAESLEWVAERAGTDGLPIHIHLAETASEVDECVRAHGLRPAHYLDRLGVLGPSTLLAHGVWLDDSERQLIADRGATLVTNPNANMKLAVGAIFDLPAARAAGIPTALGTDGAGSNNSLDLMQEVKQLALVQKHSAGDPAAVTAEEALAIATGSRAPLVGAAGPPAVGAPADFLLVRLDSPALGLGSLAAGLVYAAAGEVVDATVIAGRVLMRGGRIDGEEEIVARARERAQRLGLG
jgi:5-methylthioadenosine/S-adenosylhomocysteine deaminase